MTQQVTPAGKPASAKSDNLRTPAAYKSHAHWDESLGEYIHSHALFAKDSEGKMVMVSMGPHKHGENGNQKWLGETS